MKITPICLQQGVKKALENPARLVNIQTAANRFHTGRLTALTSLPDADAVRDLGRRIRAHTIAHLDQYLLQFEAALTALGGKVHWAKDANEACENVLQIAWDASVKRIVKSKSMVSEEICLNPRLEAAGMEIVETDLGEYIAQISGDHPSHIIAPVVHLNRQDVGRIFAEKLNVPYTEDIPELNAIARRTLREKFLDADMGISGCNFAVAETGTICLVTNEGNGRMVTSLPKVHVALMGMERILPTIKDLGVMLQLLARSASGQKMSSYTSLITGPRRPGTANGPEELHVVILDNGRSKALGSDMAEILYCIRCAACLNACPVYHSIGGHAYDSVYTGPIGSVISPILGGIPVYADLPHASTLCGACRDACPVRIDLPALFLRLRSETIRQGISPAWMKAGMKGFKWVVIDPKRYSFLTWMAGIFGRLNGKRWVSWLPGPLGGWTRHRSFPPFTRSFQQRLREDRND
jgi:L-lactate dehydrogenase complex protein LldF